MLIPLLITSIILLGFIVYYQWFLAPRLNPRNRAEMFEKQNMIAEAIVEYNKLLEKDARDYRARFRVANLYFHQGQNDEGASHYEELLRINRFDNDVRKSDILKKLCEQYHAKGDIQKVFQTYLDILKENPDDLEALYQVAFIFLGQELFDTALKYFEKLAGTDRADFSVLFGAGIAALQSQKSADAVKYFRDALNKNQTSDIGNLAMAFALQRKRDFKNAMAYLKPVIEGSSDINAVYIARRLLGFLFIQTRQPGSAIKVFEELLDFTRKNGMDENLPVLYYDLGFAAVKGEKTSMAYEYWNELYQMDRNFRDIKRLVTGLRKELDTDPGKRETSDDSVLNYVDNWVKDAFPDSYIWDICGLKSDNKIDMRNVTVTTRVSQGKSDSPVEDIQMSPSLEKFTKLDTENFKIMANRLVQKLGYSVDEILTTYRESDGVDFMAHSLVDKKKTLVWVRRWKGITVGEIPLRNFAQSINDVKAKQGLFITTTPLTPSAEQSLPNLSKITVVTPDQVGDLLAGVL